MKPEEFVELSYQVDAGVALVMINRPDRRNAWSEAMSLEYAWALHHAHTDPAVRVVLLTGAGDHFCVGADVAVLGRVSDPECQPDTLEFPPSPSGTPEAFRYPQTFALAISTPVIAALHGICAGAGVVLATYADLRFAASGSRIATSYARLGLPAEYGIGWMLPRIMGVANAAQFLYDGGPLSGQEALCLGFVQRVLPDEVLLSVAMEYSRRLARESSAESLRMIKRQLFFDATGDLETAYRRSVDDMFAALRHPDLKEGLAAFQERRPPDFLHHEPPGDLV